ncbi:hypothetical protein WH7805_03327 [Synechococcus sp. WH 7805]|nr:hypothetical protein WH7805_03327 [Synechococcus sp. WH 7805]
MISLRICNAELIETWCVCDLIDEIQLNLRDSSCCIENSNSSNGGNVC